MNNTFTLYGGLLGSEDYYALGIGIGGTLGALGALSMDINRADTQFDNRHSFHGYQWAYAVHQRYPGNQHQYRC
ncbi:fimbria/pilus outer membrane usher protein [Escherichia coli]|uniref:fimbria/pilus outer membrane usher protein n=1 Tax=Escherichia coli TaxID=562 RepID=UPI0020C307E2|nr:fimbria/pilus outer membrane usher protein [Escherichia coli]